MKNNVERFGGNVNFIRDMAEEVGLLKKQPIPEKFPCPMCRNKTIYTWRHVAQPVMIMAVECSSCGFNALTTAISVSRLNDILKSMKEEK